MNPPTERTRLLLLQTNPATYEFNSSITRERKRRVKQFQCCLCCLLLTLVLITLVITVIYSIKEEFPNNSTISNDTNITTNLPVLILLSNTFPLPDIKQQHKKSEDVQLLEAFKQAKSDLEQKDNVEKHIPSLLLHSPSYRHQRVTATSEKGRNISQYGFMEEYATRHVYKNEPNNSLVVKICLQENNTIVAYCQNRKIACNIYQKYRTFNGSCNNLNEPYLYGVAYTPFRRILPPDYADGISKPRSSKSGIGLPSARTVSLIVHRPLSRNDPKFTVMLAVWGQFLDHDITATALSQKSNGSTISCCNTLNVTSPECFPVQIENGDPFSEYNVSCMEFVRSAPALTCCLGPREQMNQATSFIDGSVIYSVDENFAKNLRTLQNGTMKVLISEYGRELLPISKDLNNGCNQEDEQQNGKYCFLAGDPRANENLHLVSMHLIWVRHHNKVAHALENVNPHWDDETIFQETRRIIAAQMQHITYNEFLPILLGNPLMQKFDLLPKTQGYFNKYNESIDPNIANSFATSSFRFAHSIIPALMKLLDNETSSPEYVQMHKMLFNPFDLYKAGTLDKTLRGVMNTSIEASDSYFTEELKSHMFERISEIEKRSKSCGLDLVSLNIQRGRDHGLPGYIQWREHCGFKKPKKFDDLKHDLDSNSLYNIKTIYSEVEDVDLYTGALSEKPLKDSILGPTITCLILDQFYRLKFGDRFWYENSHSFPGFSHDQLTELRKTSLANIICNNADDLQIIQKKVMEGVGPNNNYINCSDLDQLNYQFWKENLTHVQVDGGIAVTASAANT